MALAYLFDPMKQWQNLDGVNNVAGWLEVFRMDTDDRATVYTDFSGTLAPARISIDGNGRAVCIVESGIPYRVEHYDPSGSLLFTQQPIYTMQTGGGIPLVNVTSSDGTIEVDKVNVGSTTNYDLSTGKLQHSALVTSSTSALSEDGQFIFGDPAYSRGERCSIVGGALVLQQGWYHYSVKADLHIVDGSENLSGRVTLSFGSDSTSVDMDASYDHYGNVTVSGDFEVEGGTLSPAITISGIEDIGCTATARLSIHTIVGSGGGREYHAGDGLLLTTVGGNSTFSVDFTRVQEKLNFLYVEA